MAMNRRTAIASLASLAALGSSPFRPAMAAIDRNETIEVVQAYLNTITTMEARFSQIAPNGQLATGHLQLARPGQLKLDYDPPSKILLIAPGDWRLIFYDGSIQQVNTIPISQTPLGVLLDAEIGLDVGIEVTEIEELAGELAITLRRPDYRDAGAVTLVFERTPMELRRWTIVDAQGLATTLILENPQFGVEFARDQFRWRDPKIFGFPED